MFCKQKTAYELRISDWSSDVCSSDLAAGRDKADQMHRAAERAYTLDNLVKDLIGSKTARPLVLYGKIDARDILFDGAACRSEERRVGTECVSPCISRWSPNN